MERRQAVASFFGIHPILCHDGSELSEEKLIELAQYWYRIKIYFRDLGQCDADISK